MKKYVRTKDNIYEVREKFAKGYYNIWGNPIFENDVIAKSDTIEELCDEFVALLYDDETIYECPLGYYTETFNARTHCLQSLIKNYDIDMIGVRAIYGAIWTDKGLIYVAKVNDKGELELL